MPLLVTCLTLLGMVAARWQPEGILQANNADRVSASLNISTSSDHVFISRHKHHTIGISVITLEERKEHVEKFLRNIGLTDVARIQPAIRKVDLVERTLIKNGDLAPKSGLSMGEVACSLSHREVLKHFLNDESLTHIVVFEDDAYMSPGILQRFRKSTGDKDATALDMLQTLASTSHKHGWDGLNLGRCWSWCGMDSFMTSVPGGIHIVQAPSSLCTQAYIFTREGAKTHLEQTHPIHDAEDRARGGFKEFVYASTTPRVFLQQENDDPMAINFENDQPECV